MRAFLGSSGTCAMSSLVLARSSSLVSLKGVSVRLNLPAVTVLKMTPSRFSLCTNKTVSQSGHVSDSHI